MKDSIVITGAGVVSAIGCGKADTLAALREGRTGIGPVRHLETSLRDYPVGEIALSNEQMAALSGAPATWPRTTLMSILAIREALAQAGLETPNLVGGDVMPGSHRVSRILVSGTTVGAMDQTEKIYPEYSPDHSCGACTDLAALFVDGFDDATTLSTACSSAANAIIYGANLLRTGQCDCVVAGGSESLSNFHLNGFNTLMILDAQSCRPFDAHRSGLNLGEGAAYLVLETLEGALKRGAQPLAVLSGFGKACDAFHQTASSENGEGAYLAMVQALKRAGLQPSDIDYVNAHGTGTPNNDASESAALRRVFGEQMPPVSSTKPYTGHTTSASGSIEAVFCLLALQHGFVPAELNWSTPDPACIVPVSYPNKSGVTSCPAPAGQLKHILTNAFGFGGNDSSLILSAYE